MKSDFVIALTQLAAERNLPKEIVISAIEAALVSAYRKDSIAAGQNISVKLDPGTGEISVYVLKNVVEEVTDPQQEISVAEARRARPNAQVGDTIATDSLSHTAGRIAAQTAKQVVMQRLREAERELVFEEYADKAGEVFSIAIQRIEPRNIVVELGRAEASLPYSEQVPQERYRVGQKIKALLKSVQRSGKGPELIMSRADTLLLRRLFEMEVPEIYNGAVEIVAIAREAGSRSKVAVRAKQDGVDPVGSCVGLRGVRIQNIVNELHGEKIDVVEWSKEQARFIANALNPSQVMRVELDPSEQIALAIVPDRQLSLAIGKEGQNARLAAKLTGWKVDIKSNVDAEAILAEKAKVRAAKVAAVVEEKVAVKAQAPVAEPVAQEQPEKAVAEAPAVVEEAVTVVEQVEAAARVEPEKAPVAEVQVIEDGTAVAQEVAVEKALEPVAEVEATDETLDEEEWLPEEAEEEEKVPVLEGAAASLRDVPDDVWSLRRARMADPEPGQIRFAEDIAGLRGGVTASRRGRGREDDRDKDRGKKRNKAPKRRR